MGFSLDCNATGSSKLVAVHKLHPVFATALQSQAGRKELKNATRRIEVSPKIANDKEKPLAGKGNSKMCQCSRINVTSSNPATIRKHSGELGIYRWVGQHGGRPVYRHINNRFYLYYHKRNGGNWLINTKPGLGFGGIQNSKDVPVCPYLVGTSWQYGDSQVGGWLYDTTIQVTCADDECSVLKCGFRAKCRKVANEFTCVCKKGFFGNPFLRCYPPVDKCSCKRLYLISSGPAYHHQRDKIGEYFLWGEFNLHPVYQGCRLHMQSRLSDPVGVRPDPVVKKNRIRPLK